MSITMTPKAGSFRSWDMSTRRVVDGQEGVDWWENFLRNKKLVS